MPKARTETFTVAISAILSRRTEVLEEIAVVRERQARLTNDLGALDRTLEMLGHTASLPQTPTEQNIRTKIRRGGFTAVFFFPVMAAIGATSIRLED